MKLYVIDKAGRSVPGYGWRGYGESFDDMPDEMVMTLAETEYFSTVAPSDYPKEIVKGKPVKMTYKQVSEEDVKDIEL